MLTIARMKNGTIHTSRTIGFALDATGNDPIAAYKLCEPHIGINKMEFRKQDGGRWVPLPVGCKLTMTQPYDSDGRPMGVAVPNDDVVGNYKREKNAHGRHGTMHVKAYAEIFAASRRHKDGDEPRQQQEQEPREQEQQQEPPRQQEQPAHEFLTWVERVQAYQIEQGIDPWGMRQAINGAKLIGAGMPIAALKDAFTIDFDDEARHVLGVKPFDLIAYGDEIAQDGETAMEAIIGITIAGGVNACAVGGKGIGKTTIFERIAEKQGAKIAVISCSDDGIRPDLFGTLTPGIREGYVLAEVAEAMLRAEDGEQVFVLLDEADALTPSDAIKLNRALEQRSITHPFLGRTIKFGQNVQFFAAMNTTGNGADEDYTGRDKQDAAFLDRFFRFRVSLDRKLQRDLFTSILAAA